MQLLRKLYLAEENEKFEKEEEVTNKKKGGKKKKVKARTRHRGFG